MEMSKKIIHTAAILCILMMCACSTKPSEESNLLDTSGVHTIDILIDEADWQDLLENPELKTKYDVNVVIDGETFEHAAFSAKGNSSLAFVKYGSDSARYSFKIIFGKFTDGQTFQGLDRLNLNSCFAELHI